MHLKHCNFEQLFVPFTLERNSCCIVKAESVFYAGFLPKILEIKPQHHYIRNNVGYENEYVFKCLDGSEMELDVLYTVAYQPFIFFVF